MSRIYQQPPKTSSASNASINKLSQVNNTNNTTNNNNVVTTNKVASNVKLFTNNLSSSSSSISSSKSSSSNYDNKSSGNVEKLVSSTTSIVNNTTTTNNNNNTATNNNNNCTISTVLTSSDTRISANNKTNNTFLPPTPPTNTTEIDPMAQENLSNLIARLENVACRLETIAKPVQNGAHTPIPNVVEVEDLPASMNAFDDLISSALSSFVQISNKIGNDLKTMAELVEKAFKYERSFLLEAARSAQPSQDVLAKFYQTFSKNIEDVTSFREKNRKSEFFNHLSAISESIGALGWIAVQPAPSPYIKEMSDSAQFFTNRVLKDYKEKDPNHATWVKLWLQLLSELQAYVKQYHTTGVVWNSMRKSGTFDPSRVNSSGSSAPVAPSSSGPQAGAPPPPPPPNFNEIFAESEAKANANAAAQNASVNANALFAEINKGSNITSGLKKVTDDQKTHKNPNLRAANVVPASTTSLSVKNSGSSLNSKASTVSAKPPVFELDDKKWKIEFQNNRNDLIVDQTDLKHTVYVYQCKECTITVKGKINSILIDSCSRVGLLFDDVLSTVEFINSKNVQMQVLGRVPTVTIEKTDGCQVYLSKKSLDTEIISSKSSAMNILIPNEQDDDFSEQPVPEQFKTTINLKNRKLQTTATECV